MDRCSRVDFVKSINTQEKIASQKNQFYFEESASLNYKKSMFAADKKIIQAQKSFLQYKLEEK